MINYMFLILQFTFSAVYDYSMTYLLIFRYLRGYMLEFVSTSPEVNPEAVQTVMVP